VRRSPPPRSTGAGRGDDAGSVVPPVGQDLERGCAGADPELRLVCRSLAAVDAAPAAVCGRLGMVPRPSSSCAYCL